MKKINFLFLGLFIIVAIMGNVTAEGLFFDGKLINDGTTNASIGAKILIINAENCMGEMQGRGLRVTRVNESFQQALQLYSAQIALEIQKGSGDFKLVNQSASEVCNTKDVALKALDEFLVFNRSYFNAEKQFNLSSMNKEYNNILKSLDEERFEDTLTLVNKGYNDLSDLEASQTSLKLFYDTTTRSIKDFFLENWRMLLTWIVIIVILLIVFWKSIRREMLKIKLDNLYLRRKSINELIKKMQYDYFKTKKMSEMEYNVKLKTFEEMIRDVERQIPQLKEELMKVDMNKNESNTKELNGKTKINDNKVFKRGKR